MAFKRTEEQKARAERMKGAANDEFDVADQARGICPSNPISFESLPKTLWGHTAKGRLLYLPRTEMIVVPFEMQENGGWNVVVVRGNQTYPRGGYHLYIGPDEIETAKIVDRENLTWEE